MIVRPLLPADEPVLSSFLDDLGGERPSRVLAYHLPFHRDLMERHHIGKPVWLGAWDGERLTGILPALLRRTDIGSVLCSLPFFGPNAGPLCRESDAGAVVPALVEAARDILRAEPKPLSMTIYGALGLEDDDYLARAMPDAVIIDRFSQVTRLDGSPWSKGLRYDIRRAHSLGLGIDDRVDSSRIRDMYALYRQNCTDAGIPPKSPDLVADLAAQARPGGPVRVYFAFLDGAMVAALIVLWGPRTLSYYLPCTLAEARALQPGAALIAHAAEQARAAGLILWNWESSPSRESGVYRFKARWNAEEVPFRIRVEPFIALDALRALGRDRLAEAFPHYFVYPFDRL